MFGMLWSSTPVSFRNLLNSSWETLIISLTHDSLSFSDMVDTIFKFYIVKEIFHMTFVRTCELYTLQCYLICQDLKWSINLRYIHSYIRDSTSINFIIVNVETFSFNWHKCIFHEFLNCTMFTYVLPKLHIFVFYCRDWT